MRASTRDADVIVVGGGLAGLVATAEIAAAGRRVILVDQEPEGSLGGQAFWSLGGLFLVDSPEQRRLGISDSRDLAWRDWLGSAGFDRPDDAWPRRWAEAYVDFAAGEQRDWLRARGVAIAPEVGWAEPAVNAAVDHGNSVPRFHLARGIGPGLLRPLVARVRSAQARGLVDLQFRHRVDRLLTGAGGVVGVAGTVLAPDDAERGHPSGRRAIGAFSLDAGAVLVASGGVGGNHERVRRNWPARLGSAPRDMLCGVPAHVDGRMIQIVQQAGGRAVHSDRMWSYVQAVRNWDPIWPGHGISVLSGPSPLWLDARGRRLPVTMLPSVDTLGALEHILGTGHEHSWFVLTQVMLETEVGLSGSDQNPDLVDPAWRSRLRAGLSDGALTPLEAFKRHGEDFVVAGDLPTLVAGMNARTDEPLVAMENVRAAVEERDREIGNPFSTDPQVVAINDARRGLPGVTPAAPPHRLLDPSAGPLIAIRLRIVTRKTLGGLLTDLQGRVLDEVGAPIPGLFAAGEAAGFGGGGMHGYRALEGSFLGGCLFSGREAGRAIADALR